MRFVLISTLWCLCVAGILIVICFASLHVRVLDSRKVFDPILGTFVAGNLYRVPEPAESIRRIAIAIPVTALSLAIVLFIIRHVNAGMAAYDAKYRQDDDRADQSHPLS